MNITFAPNGHLQIDDARIVYRNFAGVAGTFNREGDRNFSIVIDDEDVAEALRQDKNEFGVGWNVKSKPPREDGEMPFMHLPVKVKFNGRGPNIYLVSGGARVKLSEDTVACLDDADIIKVDLDIRPYDGEARGTSFRSAYLYAMEVTQQVDRFAARYAEEY
jgi:hypothetical protein